MIFNRGNHLQGWHEYEGWTITKRNDDWWVYANGNNGTKLSPSNLRVGVDPVPDIQTSSFPKGIKPAPFEFFDNAPIPNLQMMRTDTFHVPLILHL